MSADNQAEPVAAVAAPNVAAAAGASSAGAGSEYLKRTCLICGCQTNQTINIYEPRSGPNIVQLIQAKFKFQVSLQHTPTHTGRGATQSELQTRKSISRRNESCVLSAKGDETKLN